MNDASRLTQRIMLALALLALLGGLTYQAVTAGIHILLQPVALLLEGAVVTVALMGFLSARGVRVALEEEISEREQIERSLRQLVDEIGSFAEGDLRIRASTVDSVTGSLAEVINGAVDLLIDIASGMDSAAGRARAAAATASSVSYDLASSAEAQASAIDRVAKTVEDLAAFMQRTASRLEAGVDAGARGSSLAADNTQTARRAACHLSAIGPSLEGSIGAVKRIGAVSAEIAEIVALINDIADQTNILALNAAIQASMAGDAGRGFSVVADEVQRLAERSSAATKQIAGLADTVEEEAESAAQLLAAVAAETSAGTGQMQGLLASADEMITSMTTLAGLVDEVDGDVREQVPPSVELIGLLGQMRQISAQALAAAERSRPSAAELASALAEVGSLTDHFVLPPVSPTR